jgi:hypothetical protein
MPSIHIFVEDKLCEVYEVLAAKALAFSAHHAAESDKHSIRASQVTLDELISDKHLLDLARRSQRSGCQQVIFALDHEGSGAAPERADARHHFREAFQALCNHIACLSDEDPLKQLRLVRVEVHSCLEAWLLSDPQAIVKAFSGPADYRPDVRQTEALSPREARDGIAHIVRQIGGRKGNRRLARMRGSDVKSEGAKIAEHLDLDRARRNNRSLDYFCEMVAQQGDGCRQPCPELD